MVGATAVCGVLWTVVVVSAALLASGAHVTLVVGPLMWSGKLPAIIAALALALPGMAGIAAGAMAHDRRAGFLQGVLALSACEVPVLIAAACTVFSQHAVAGGLVAAIIATYALTWFLLAMGFAFELPVVSARRAKISMATPLAGGAPRLPAPLAGRPKYPTRSLRPRRAKPWLLKLSSPRAGQCLTSLSVQRT